jgi:F-type H+-transporting ATPase subunit alpha
MLKQDERQPIPVEEQVAVIFAAANGYLDDVDTNDVPDWEGQYRDYLRDSHGEILQSIRDEQQVTDETRSSLEEATGRFNENYEPQTSSIVDASSNGSSDGESDGSEDEGS